MIARETRQELERPGDRRCVSVGLEQKLLPMLAYRTVTAENRIGQVVSGDVDLECGSTTRNKARQQVVAFSPVFFVAGFSNGLATLWVTDNDP